ncbi:thyrotroph embryonic factor-like isoform X3 [Ostrea edulis]|uniref:thyrotroph embryonic factor-like isoform X3 n=1 Tax=Ostrea edulis TaxID=37623 RepID=UPI002095D1C0|nr:thyrotroph embryonic factor-like isoform X3 [Ostrea edulis]
MAFNSNEDGRYTLKDLLEIPELQHPPLLNRPANLKKGEVSLGYGITSAFLGPNLWNTSQVGGPDNGEFSLQYMDLDEFLSENGIPSTELKKDDGQQILDSPEPKRAVTPTEDYIQLQTAPAAPLPQNGGFSPKNSPIHGYEGVHEASPPYYNTETFRIPPSKHTDSSNGPSLPPQQLQDKDPSTQPTTITGHENFDPRKCKFTDDELKPQPIIKKSRKVFVPEDCKDEKYWMRRTKNNIAAQRSREARRIKENQIALRAAFLEKENNALKDEVKMIKEENTKLLKKLSQYEKAV